MFELFCKCPKCGNNFVPDFDETLKAYYEQYYERRVIAPLKEPPELPEYMILRCLNPKCKYLEKMTHIAILQLMTKGWAELAWAEVLSDKNQEFSFEEHFTRYIMANGLHKIVSQKDLDNNEVLRDYMKYVEEQSIEESDD